MEYEKMHPYHVYDCGYTTPCDFWDCSECMFANCCDKANCVLPHYDPYLVLDGGDMFE